MTNVKISVGDVSRKVGDVSQRSVLTIATQRRLDEVRHLLLAQVLLATYI